VRDNLIARVRKAQISLFVLMGVIIMVIAGFLVYVSTTTTETSTDEEIVETAEVAYESQPEIKRFIDSCIQPIVLQGLEIMRLQGGYIDIPSGTQTLTIKEKDNKKVVVVDSSKKVVIGDGLNKIPLWLTETSLNIPSKESMQEELSDYINKELRKCVNDFSYFKGKGFKISAGNINSNVEFGKAVVVNVDFPVSAEKDDQKYQLKEFIFQIPVDMELITAMASDLAILEEAYAFVEDHTKSLISLYSAVDKNSLPPISATDVNLDCDYVTWTKPEVKEMLKKILTVNMPLLKIEGTNFKRIKSNDPIIQGVYDSFIYEFFQEEFPNLKVDLIFNPEIDFEFDIKPSSGSSIIPDRHSQTNIPLLPMFCSFKYQYKYTLLFPVMISVTDNESAEIDPISNSYKERAGFTFQFPVLVVLHGNQARVNRGRPQYGVNLEKVSSELGATTVKTFFCDEKQRISNEVTIRTYDLHTGLPLDNTDVHIYASSSNDCLIGRTDEKGVLKTKLPICYNCQIYFTKQGYTKLVEPITVAPEQKPKTVAYSLEPFTNLTVKVKKVHLPTFVENFYKSDGFTKSCGSKTAKQLLEESIFDLGVNETATITLEGTEPIPIIHPPMESVNLVSGNYNLSIFLSGIITVKPSVYDYGSTTRVISFNQKGGVFKGIWMLGSTDINIKLLNLKSKKKITFYALVEHLPEEDLEVKSFDNPIIQVDGNLTATLNVDDDCNPLTPLQERTIEITEKQYTPYIIPTVS
jgi:hypothetical protein